jgi:exodeoxyribonuclease VII large subunit
MPIERGLFDEPREPALREPALREPALREPPPSSAPPAAATVLTVTELTRRIAGAVAGLGRVSVDGELTRITRAASGHVYFDLKDLDSKLACTLWKSQLERAVRFELAEGMRVVAHGRLDVYAPRGTYSLNVQRLEQAGLGELLARLEELKARLRAEGWFDRARPLPALPRVVGVVTSRDGAAFQDVLRTRSLRWPGYPLRLAHTPVQGAGAAQRIAAAIRRLDRSGVDVIIVCRGGGSLEDLWAFNELPVAEAIRAASVPVVSGVGHEVDVTLADLVADLRAHTPTDAAQAVIPERAAYLRELERAAAHLARAVDGYLTVREHELARLAASPALRDPGRVLRLRAGELEHLFERLRGAATRRHDRAGTRLGELHRRLERRGPRERVHDQERRLAEGRRRLLAWGRGALAEREQAFAVLAERLEGLSPLKILARGYSITTRLGAAQALRDAAELAAGDVLSTRLARGRVESRVTRTE